MSECVLHALFNEHSPIKVIFLQRLFEPSSTSEYYWAYCKDYSSDHRQLASHMSEIFFLKNKFITYPDWRMFSERSRRMLLLWFKIFKSLNSWFFTCLKDQQRLSLLNKITWIIYSSQSANLPRSFENQSQSSDPITFS
jgi:hypothetical protein